jgi:hypothetical protein
MPVTDADHCIFIYPYYKTTCIDIPAVPGIYTTDKRKIQGKRRRHMQYNFKLENAIQEA